MSSALNRPALWGAVAAAALLCACDAYKEDLLGDSPSSGGGQGGASGTAGGDSGTGGMGDGGAGTGGEGGMCMPEPESCNLLDDDCDGVRDEDDEDTVKACEAIVVNAETQCVASRGRARCLKIACRSGFEDGNGRPEDGCETALDEGDGGADEDAGP